jgi:excisionase family DNA binding protein
MTRVADERNARNMTTTNNIPTLTEDEAAEFLKVKKNVVRGLRERGELEHHRIVRDRVRYTMQALLDYLERCKVPRQD